jgi:hypothetical protein
LLEARRAGGDETLSLSISEPFNLDRLLRRDPPAGQRRAQWVPAKSLDAADHKGFELSNT